ncbi:hypothetical protein L2E82_30768 [Cichorium intybus]|uniref:Uncharacterized protein n=1 Tax=Cichorium intybus TaxID=13427 RepID=A0ACB9D1D7_CICIN|nr:hypothetical protein L2E82_30768 [Cichorium intybus]
MKVGLPSSTSSGEHNTNWGPNHDNEHLPLATLIKKKHKKAIIETVDIVVPEKEKKKVSEVRDKKKNKDVNDALKEDWLEKGVPFEDAVFENVPTGQEVNDNGKEVNEVHFGVDESLEKINNKEINDEILENFVVDTEPLSMTQILNEQSVMTQLEIEAYNIISKHSGNPCSPIHSLVVGESSKHKVIEKKHMSFIKKLLRRVT